MDAVHPALWWGVAVATLPVVLHLLLRQRPQPRPWAAMRWLRQAAHEASRTWKLTNLLLLMLRMALLITLAVAVARPLLGAFAGGGTLLIVVDRTASMGARGDDAGPLAHAAADLAAADIPYARAVVVGVPGLNSPADIVADGGPRVVQSLGARCPATELPGGLDDAVAGLAPIEAALGDIHADVLLLSDFQHDRGDALVAALGARAGRVARWAPGSPTVPGANAWIAGVDTGPDVLPGQPGRLGLRVGGRVHGVTTSVDGGPFLGMAMPRDDSTGLRTLDVPLPALSLGRHLVRVRVADDGLLSDNLLEVPVMARGPVPVLLVQGTPLPSDYLGAALAADPTMTQRRLVRPEALGQEPLPAGTLVALRSAVPPAASQRLAAWVRDGGALWTDLATLHEDPHLQALVPGLAPGPLAPGGPWASGMADVDSLLGVGGMERVPTVTLMPAAAVILRAGTAPAAAIVPVGSGRMLLEIAPLRRETGFQARSGTPLWAMRHARSLTERAPVMAVAGSPAPRAEVLRREGTAITTRTGEPLRAAPGFWSTIGEEGVTVLPSPDEARCDRDPHAPATLADALPTGHGADLGPWLLLIALALAITEGAVAAWAGRTYGR